MVFASLVTGLLLSLLLGTIGMPYQVIFIIAMLDITPVSYTHLDVYKRQWQYLALPLRRLR